MHVRRALVLLAILIAAAGCTRKKKAGPLPPEQLSGLAAVPASARVVIGASPDRLADSPVVARAFTRLLERDADLSMRVERLAAGCGFDWRTQVQSVHLALTDTAPQPMLVVTGQLSEADLAKCVQTTVGAGGGLVTTEQTEGRTLYKVVEGDRTVWFAFGQRDTIVLSASRELVLTGLGRGQKVLDVPEMRALIERLDIRSPIWAVGRVDSQLGQRLSRLTGAEVKEPPRAFHATLDPTDGLHADLSMVTASAEDAKVLESHADSMIGLIALAAQARDLGPLAAKISSHQEGDTVHLTIALTQDELNEALSKVDTSAPPAQDAQPSHGP